MLTSLSIKDYALIENVNIEFHHGLNIITGETGAGKSILLGALGLLLGERANTDVVRKGTKKTIVEGVFEVECNEKVNNVLGEHDIESGPELFVRREVSLKGSNRCFLNDTPVNLSVIKSIGNLLVDIHGQHEHQSILDITTHIELLDDSGDVNKLLSDFRKTRAELNAKISELNSLRKRELALAEKRDLYEFQINEIDAISPVAGEEEDLENELRILENSERLIDATSVIYSRLYEEENNVYDNLNQVLNLIDELSSIDNTFKERAEQANSAVAIIDDLAGFARTYRDSIDLDPEKLTDIRDRLSGINRLKKKFGGSLEAVLTHRKKIGAEFELADNFTFKIEEIVKELQELRISAGKKAVALTKARNSISELIIPQIEETLSYLGIQDAAFRINFGIVESEGNSEDYLLVNGQKLQFDTNGVDQVEFFISTNFGEDPKPLVRVASGGEISRIMLVLKTILAKNDKLPLLVFDEIDTGVSGRIAQKVGRTMKSLTEHHQIIAITHLPQIASLADYHYSVEKQTTDGRVVSYIKELNKNERIDEVAKLLSGEELSDASRKSAKELMGM